MYNRPPGLDSTNSPLESLNRSIKRIFTLNKLLSVTKFVEIMIRMSKYYSVRQEEFATEPIPNSKAKKYGKIFGNKKYFKRIDKERLEFKNSKASFILNLKNHSCNCKYYYKYRVCGHLLGVISLMNRDEFVRKPKRGGQKKAKPALIKD